MQYNPDVHHRRSIRLQGYDYSQAGAYFVTICTQNRECLFGDVLDGKMVLNDAGRMVQKWYIEMENKFPDILCDEYVIMPNHFHTIIINVGADLRVCPDKTQHDRTGAHAKMGEHAGSPLHCVVQWFKTMTTNEYIRGVKQNIWSPFPGKLWQRNYWDRIIRDEKEYDNIVGYIFNNPQNWGNDELYELPHK